MIAKVAPHLRSKEAALYIGVSNSTLTKWRMRGEGPPYHRCGPRIIIYYADEIDTWLRNGAELGTENIPLAG